GDFDAVRIRQPGNEVILVAHKRKPRVRLVALEHPGSGADAGLCPAEVTELLDGLVRHDPRHRVREIVETPPEGLAQGEPDGRAIEHVDLLNVAEGGSVRVALDL